MGKRFQYYLNDSVKIPRQTIYSRKKRKKENILHQFNKICITKLDIATDYKMLSRELLNITNESIDYSKHWFCNKCSKKIVYFLLYTCNESNKATSFNYNQDVISDVSDGEYYKYFKTNMPSNNSGFENNYSMTLNTDGIELSLKSNISVWPVYLSINEIPIQYRFYIDNILIAGSLIKYVTKKNYT
ncbi:hypothetical protein BpHYR1_034527 [Brachionus plicatilis]|uniref:Uncharacterized protein n=1 Tax=Brachionus plicatilis TaxID=10195 RepID=A0A3M7R6I0_BRAPC|nr:hypothetical protein BpHYR1_034527 [Brachionus plicatilis]